MQNLSQHNFIKQKHCLFTLMGLEKYFILYVTVCNTIKLHAKRAGRRQIPAVDVDALILSQLIRYVNIAQR